MPPPKILVVEDDLHTRNIIEMVLKRDRMLRYHQLEVICAGDGEEGLALFREHAPDLLITDLLMPKMDGFELVKAVRGSESNADLPILATSAIVRDKTVLRRLERDYDVRLQLKPFSPKVLALQIRKILQEMAAEESPEQQPAGAHAVTATAVPPGAPAATARPRSPGRPPEIKTALAPPAKTETQGEPATPVARETGAGQSINGDLSEAPLAPVLLDAFENQWCGTLEVRRGQLRKLIHLLSGYPIFVRSNLRNETLGQLLVRRGGLTEDQHQQTVRLAQQHGLRYGEALVRLKLLSDEEVMAELVAQTRYKVQSCLRWRDGTWRFEEDAEIGGKVPRCTVEPLEVVFAGLRRHHSVEEAISLLQGGHGALNHIVKRPRFDEYREAFAESFGWDLVELIGTGCPLSKLSEAKGKQDLAVQLDVMLQTRMVDLRERPAAPPEGARDELGSALGPAGSAQGGLRPVSTDMLSLKNLAGPASTGSSASPSDTKRERSAHRRRVESPEVRMARQLIEATYLGLHEKNHYEVLGVIPDTNAAGIEVAYRVKRKQFDLGRFSGMDLGLAYGYLEEICAALDSAFDVLRVSESRQAYNQALAQEGAERRDVAMRAEELFRAGSDLLGQGRYAEALRMLEEATQLDDQTEYRVQEAYAYFLAHGQAPDAGAEAMVRVQSALASDPEQPRAHLVAASISSALGSVDEAVQHLHQALRLDPTFEDAFNQLERLLLERGEVERLEQEYRRAIFLVGNSERRWAASLWGRLSQLYREQMGDDERAHVAAEAALKLNPNDSGLRASLADADSRDPNRWPEAVCGFRAILLQQPTNRTALHKIYEIHSGAGRVDAAFVAASAAMVQGVADGEQLRTVDAYAREGVPRVQGGLSDSVLSALIHPDEDLALSKLYVRLSPLMLRQHPVTPEMLGAAADATGAPVAPDGFAAMLDYVCVRLGVEVPPLRLKDADDAWVGLSATDRPELLVSTDALTIVDERELCFRLARALYPLKTSSLVARVSAAELLGDYLFATITLLAQDRDLPPQTARMRHIQRELQRDADLLDSCGAAVAELLQRSETTFDSAVWLRATSRAADRLGMLFCADVIVAARVVGEQSAGAHVDLIDFALSEEHESLRRQLGLCVT